MLLDASTKPTPALHGRTAAMNFGCVVASSGARYLQRRPQRREKTYVSDIYDLRGINRGRRLLTSDVRPAGQFPRHAGGS